MTRDDVLREFDADTRLRDSENMGPTRSEIGMAGEIVRLRRRMHAIMRQARGIVVRCDNVHHGKADRHGPTDPCPVVARWESALLEDTP